MTAERALLGGNSFEPLIDGEAVFPRLLREVESARDSLLVMQLLNKPFFEPDPRRPKRVTLDRALVEAARRGVQVRILLNQNGVAPDDSRWTARWFAKRAKDLPILVRPFPVRPGVAHAKMVVVDAERALLVDPPFEPRWWDTRKHPLRSRVRGFGYPEHHVSAALRGPVVRELTRTFETLWNERADESRDGEATLRMAEADGDDDASGDVTMRVVRTSPKGVLTRDGESEILRSYREAFDRARSWIYVENQYFTSRRARDLVRRALRRNPALRVILVLNERPDAWFYPRMQDARLREIGWPREERLGVFSLWRVGADEDGRHAARPIYVHSKVSIVDDAWATLGSANLDAVGLDRWALPLDYRSIELNVEIPSGRAVSTLRRDLWSEHLGRPAPELAEEPPAGWLAAWRAQADANLATLARGGGDVVGNLLPYHPALPRGIRRLGWFAPAGPRAEGASSTKRAGGLFGPFG